MYSNIQKGLDKLENPLVRQTVEFLISKVEDSSDDESCDIAKSALLMYLNAAAPGVLKADIAVENALNKSFGEATEEEVLDSEQLLKEAMAESGIYYFGPLDKHFRKNPPKAPGPAAVKHIPVQKPHGNRPGKRTLIGLLAAWKKHFDPDIKIPSRARMILMSLHDVHALAGKYIPEHVITGIGNVIRSAESHAGGELRDRPIDGSDAHRLMGRGQGLNMRENEYVNNIIDLVGSKPLKGQNFMVQHITEAPRTPGTQVVDSRPGATRQPKNVEAIPADHPYHESGARNQGQVWEEKKPKKAGPGHEALGTARNPINRYTGKPRKKPKTSFYPYAEHTAENPNPQTPRVNPMRPARGLGAARIARIKRNAATMQRPPDERLGAPSLGSQLERAQNPLPEVITGGNLSALKGTVMGDNLDKLSPEVRAKIVAALPMSVSKLNGIINLAIGNPDNLKGPKDLGKSSAQVFNDRLEKMRARKQGS
jgi:hypothetical protein